MAILELKNVSFGYGRDAGRILHDVSAAFETGTVYALIGRSGAGKSTLLGLLSALLLPTEGSVCFKGEDTRRLNALAYRRRCVATVYQDFALFPLLNVTENILYPLELQRVPAAEALARAEAAADQVGLAPELMVRYPSALSGGEQQRVAIARALAAGSEVILADEPTGNLDEQNAAQIVDLLVRAAHEAGRCVILVTHDSDVAARADHTLRLTDGSLLPAD
ncbi:MAG: ABC transporter ATP-binding protein [Lachnospiraceae bacterium]|nr:ABC transporter ATP-binding protein [Lachnospiraceae bacterium]